MEDTINRFLCTFDLHTDVKVPQIMLPNPYTHAEAERHRLTSPYEKLIIKDRQVLWIKGGIVARKLSYTSDIINAFFTHFESPKNDTKLSTYTDNASVYNKKRRRDYKKGNIISSTDPNGHHISSNSEKRSLVVVLDEQIHVYEESGSSNVVSFPFRIKSAFAFNKGLIIGKEPETTPFFERLLNASGSSGAGIGSSGGTGSSQRQPSFNQRQMSLGSNTSSSGLNSNKISSLSSSHSPEGNFLTLLQPLEELGSVVSSSTTSFSSREELICFPSAECTIAATYNPIENVITLYHTRYLSRNIKSAYSNNSTSKIFSNFRRPSKRSISSAMNTAATPSATKIIDELDQQQQQQQQQQHQRRSASMMSFDRMASGISDFEPINTKDSGSLEYTRLRKDIIFTELNVIDFNQSIKYLKCFSLSCKDQEQESLAICNYKRGEIDFSIYNSSLTSISLPSFKSFYNVSGLDAVPINHNDTNHQGYVVLLSDNYHISLINPFLGISSAYIDLSNRFPPILRLDDANGSEISIYCSNGKHYSLNLFIEPQNDLIGRLMHSLKYLSNSYIYDYFWLQWCSNMSLNIIHNDEWSCFVITLLSLIIPDDDEGSLFDYDKNEITRLMKLTRSVRNHNKSHSSHYSLQELAPSIILSFHIIREDLRLNILAKDDLHNLSMLLSQLACWCGWSDLWTKYYMIDHNILDTTRNFMIPQQLHRPPNLFESLSSLFSTKIVPYVTFMQVVEEDESIDRAITPRTFYILRIFEMLVSPNYNSVDVINLMVEYDIKDSDLETYPPGIFFPLKNSVLYCQENVSMDWFNGISIPKLELIDRKDLLEFLSSSLSTIKEVNPLPPSLEYPKEMTEILSAVNDLEMVSAWDFQEEADKFHVTKLIFSEDRRFYELTKLLQTSKVQSVTYIKEDTIRRKQENSHNDEESMSVSNQTEDISLPQQQDRTEEDEEAENLKQRKKLAVKNALRTLTKPLGRSAVFISSRKPLMTERFPIPKMNLNSIILPDAISVTLEKDSIEQDTYEWGFFHNGCSSGLMISKETKEISGSWIVFNRPPTLNSQHAGFLLGLGLNGHLKSLEEWHIYNYLGPKHVFTSVGLLIGMAASLKGTMNVKLTKVLSVHVVALLPSGSSDLNVALPVQTAGLIGIGLLYLESQHRRMTEILLNQISASLVSNEKEFVNEGYRLAAGIALGYINLGKGEVLKNKNDTHVIDQLVSIAISMKDIQTTQEQDKSISGAIIALLFMFLKTNNDEVARKLAIPTTLQQLDYIRPDFLLLRCLSNNLIMWDSISNNRHWVESQIPSCLKEVYDINKISFLDSDFLSYLYIIGGSCLSIGVKYASTNDDVAKMTVLSYLDQFISLCKLKVVKNSYDTKVAMIGVQNVRDILLISASLIMAGSGDLDVLKRLRFLQDEFKDTIGYGNYMAINTSLGFLFLGRGQQAFNTSDNFAIAALVTSIYPVYTSKNDDNEECVEIQLQALRHFWAFSVEPRCLITRDVESKKPITADVIVELKNGDVLNMRSPCLLPNLKSIATIQTDSHSNRYYKFQLDFDTHKDLFKKFKETLTIFVYKRNDKRNLPLIEEKGKVEMVDNEGDNLLLPLQDLNIFQQQNLNEFENLQLLNSQNNVIDFKFEILSKINKPKSIDDLWNLKLIFSFIDNLQRDEEEELKLLSVKSIEDLKISLWKANSS